MLSASHLTRRFGERTAVDDVSFELAAGEIFALLGPNGAGKTTILRMLGGLIAPSSGTVRLGDEAIRVESRSRLRSTIGFLTETPGLWERLSVRQNLDVHAKLHGLAPSRTAVERALALFELADRQDQPAVELSKGLRQRVALARALMHDPRIVLLDEPTSGLDPESARDVRALIRRMRGEGRSVLLSTHNLDEVERVADRVAVLKTRLIAVDTPAALRARLFGARVRITVTSGSETFASMLRSAFGVDVSVDGAALSVAVTERVRVPLLVRHLVELGAEIDAVVPEEPPLEEVYLRLLQEVTT